ncbi:MAG TPA: hypothetical protein VK139_06670 [Microbacteriaceae bacterium]|nr:hypothetical protein [Microbacteriaceae bacterium]
MALGAAGVVASGGTASALGLADCGPAQSIGTLSFDGTYCIATFNNPSPAEFTLPAGAQSVTALLVGAGQGSSWINPSVTTVFGYTGQGGEVLYADLSEVDGNTLTIDVSEEGITDSTISDASQTWTARGGNNTSLATNLFCQPVGHDSVYLLLGWGSGGYPTGDNGNCVSNGPYVNPSAEDADAYGNPVPDGLRSVDWNLGGGGRVAFAPETLDERDYGQGGELIVDEENATATAIDPQLGVIVLSWIPTASTPTPSPTSSGAATLATTGASTTVAWFAGALSLAGAVLALAGRARRRAE